MRGQKGFKQKQKMGKLLHCKIGHRTGHPDSQISTSGDSLARNSGPENCKSQTYKNLLLLNLNHQLPRDSILLIGVNGYFPLPETIPVSFSEWKNRYEILEPSEFLDHTFEKQDRWGQWLHRLSAVAYSAVLEHTLQPQLELGTNLLPDTVPEVMGRPFAQISFYL